MIDKQHRQIIEAANQFFIRRKCGKNKCAVEECLRFLQQYILYHFQAEESFQRMCGFPEYNRHCALHKSIATQVKFFSVKITASNYDEKVIQDFYLFLVEWVQKHVFEEDLAFTQFYVKINKPPITLPTELLADAPVPPELEPVQDILPDILPDLLTDLEQELNRETTAEVATEPPMERMMELLTELTPEEVVAN